MKYSQLTTRSSWVVNPIIFVLTVMSMKVSKKRIDFLQNQSHPPTVEVAKEWKRRLTGADGEGHESPSVCKLLDKVEFVTHRQFGARSLLTHFCVIRSALK